MFKTIFNTNIDKLCRAFVASKLAKIIIRYKNMLAIINKCKKVYANFWKLCNNLYQLNKFYLNNFLYKNMRKI